MVELIHNFDPKWVKKRLGPLEKPLRMAYVCFASIKIKPFFLILPEGSTKLRLGGAGAEYLIFHSLCGPLDRKKPITRAARVFFYLFSGIE